ncbi:MAG TPA: hypothetical protein PL193_01010 [Xanthobacteraceae bacterium]|nr:hypothetical protein [Xanthobacteraceae bacterium]
MITREEIVGKARGWIGTPYRHQASCKGVDCDCLGFLRGLWREIYGEEPELPPPYAADRAEASKRETLAEAARRHMEEIALDDLVAAGGQVIGDTNTFVGSATGPRYNVTANGIMYAAGAGETYLPGSSAGATSTGGLYI